MIGGKKWVFFSDMLKLIFHKNRSSAPRLSENWVNKIEVAVFESEIKMASSQYPSKEASGNFEVAQKIQLPFFYMTSKSELYWHQSRRRRVCCYLSFWCCIDWCSKMCWNISFLLKLLARKRCIRWQESFILAILVLILAYLSKCSNLRN